MLCGCCRLIWYIVYTDWDYVLRRSAYYLCQGYWGGSILDLRKLSINTGTLIEREFIDHLQHLRFRIDADSLLAHGK